MLQTVEQTQWISIAQAVNVCREQGNTKSENTIRYWATNYTGFAKKIGGRWRVNLPVLHEILDGNPPPPKEKERLSA